MKLLLFLTLISKPRGFEKPPTEIHFWFIHSLAVCQPLRELGAHRVVGNIRCVAAGEPSLRPVRDTNSGKPRRLTSPSLARWRYC